MKRIVFAKSAFGAVALAAGTRLASAAAKFPDRPITVIVPWGAGGGSDQMARAAAAVLPEILNVSVPVINVPGANGNNGIVKLVGGDADGYTIAVLVGDTFMGNLLSKSPPLWQLKDIVPLAVMNRQPFAYYVASNSPNKTWADVEKAARQNPFKVGLSGFGGVEDAVTTYLAKKGMKFVGVPFPKPGERYAAVLGGQVDMMCDPDGNVRRYVESGQMRGIMVFSTGPVPELPGTKTARELGYDVVLSEWRGFVAKAGTEPAEVQVLSQALARAYKTPQFESFVKTSWSAADSFIPASKFPAFLAAQEQQLKAITTTG